MKELRAFEDLIKEIEFEGDKFIPAQKIASLCFNYNDKAVKRKARMWVNDGYDYMMWYNFETTILKPKSHKCAVGISRLFDIRTYHYIDDCKDSNVGHPACNQVEIVKCLVKWGFIEL